MARFLFFINIFLVTGILFSPVIQAQYKAKSWLFSTKISFADYSDKNDWKGYSINKIPPISISLEKGINNFFSTGGYIGYYGNKYTNDTLSINTMRDKTFALGAIGSIHYAHWIEKLSHYKIFLGDFDFYVSGTLQMSFNRVKKSNMPVAENNTLESEKYNKVTFRIRPVAGLRYFVSDNFSMLLEFGKGNLGMVTTGVTWQIDR